MDRMGHAQITTTQKYLHTLPDADTKNLNALDRIRKPCTRVAAGARQIRRSRLAWTLQAHQQARMDTQLRSIPAFPFRRARCRATPAQNDAALTQGPQDP